MNGVNRSNVESVVLFMKAILPPSMTQEPEDLAGRVRAAFARNLAVFMEAKGLENISALHREMLRNGAKDISISAVRRWVKGEGTPTLENLAFLAVFFGCEVDAFLREEKARKRGKPSTN